VQLDWPSCTPPVVPKLFPLIVIVPPERVTLAMCGRWNVRSGGPAFAWPLTVTTTLPEPEPGGSEHVIRVCVTAVTGQETPPTVTAALSVLSSAVTPA
jgi:hypothetical protein